MKLSDCRTPEDLKSFESFESGFYYFKGPYGRKERIGKQNVRFIVSQEGFQWGMFFLDLYSGQNKITPDKRELYNDFEDLED